MGNQRLEVVGNLGNQEVEWLKSLGCFTEVINWKMRVFVPVYEEGVAVIEKICGKNP
jgi:hypothetical protein